MNTSENPEPKKKRNILIAIGLAILAALFALSGCATSKQVDVISQSLEPVRAIPSDEQSYTQEELEERSEKTYWRLQDLFDPDEGLLWTIETATEWEGAGLTVQPNGDFRGASYCYSYEGKFSSPIVIPDRSDGVGPNPPSSIESLKVTETITCDAKHALLVDSIFIETFEGLESSRMHMGENFQVFLEMTGANGMHLEWKLID